MSLESIPRATRKLKVLRALRPITAHDAGDFPQIRNVYGAGAVGGQPVAGYLADLGTDQSTQTETFVALKAEVRTWRWANVPFYLRTGKRLPQKVSEIVLQFRTHPFSIFPADVGDCQPNRLIIRLQPEEGMRVAMMTKEPGPGGLRLVADRARHQLR